ncbi:MAG: hypothetical protein WCI55_06095 [Armatimonadota bacterium]
MIFKTAKNTLSSSEQNLLLELVSSITNSELKTLILTNLSKYQSVVRDAQDKSLRFSRFFLGKYIPPHKPIKELSEEVELARAKLQFSDGSTMSIELHGVGGHLYGLCSRDSRVANLYKNPFEIVWIKSVYDPTKPNPKVVAARKKYLPNLDLEPFGWERRSKTALELIEIDEKEYIMLWEKEEEILLGHRGKVYRYNMIDDDNLGVVTAEELKVS